MSRYSKILIIFHFKRLSQQLQRLFCPWLYVAILLFVSPASAYSLCAGDFDADGDVDGLSLFELISSKKGVVSSFFAGDFGRVNCPPLPATPLNQFNIGDSISETAFSTLGILDHLQL